MSTSPLATYREANLERKGTYTLYPERVDLVLTYALRGTVQMSVPLATLSPEVATVHVRNSVFNLGVWALGLSVIVLGLLSTLSIYTSLGIQALLYSVLVFGAVLVLLGLRRLRFVSVLGDDGSHRLPIGEGPDGPPALDQFIEAIRDAIRAQRGAA